MTDIKGLGDDWVADTFGCGDGRFGRTDQNAAWHRQTNIAQQPVSQFFVAGGLDSDVGCESGDSRTDTLLVFAVTELNQALVIESNGWDATAASFVDDRLGAGTERQRIR